MTVYQTCNNSIRAAAAAKNNMTIKQRLFFFVINETYLLKLCNNPTNVGNPIKLINPWHYPYFTTRPLHKLCKKKGTHMYQFALNFRYFLLKWGCFIFTDLKRSSRHYVVYGIIHEFSVKKWPLVMCTS